jgi:hypothetical protein
VVYVDKVVANIKSLVLIWNVTIREIGLCQNMTIITSKSTLSSVQHISDPIRSLEVPGLAEKRPSVLVGQLSRL